MIIKQVDLWHLNCRFKYQFKYKLRKIALYAIIASHKRLGLFPPPWEVGWVCTLTVTHKFYLMYISYYFPLPHRGEGQARFFLMGGPCPMSGFFSTPS
jgi:hypothetical protein